MLKLLEISLLSFGRQIVGWRFLHNDELDAIKKRDDLIKRYWQNKIPLADILRGQKNNTGIDNRWEVLLDPDWVLEIRPANQRYFYRNFQILSLKVRDP